MSDVDAKTATVSQLKADIDSGRTGDKVGNADPGLSPLGTDDEAGGRPNKPEVVAQARREERARSFEQEPDPGKPIGKYILPVVIAIVVVLVLVVFMLKR